MKARHILLVLLEIAAGVFLANYLYDWLSGAEHEVGRSFVMVVVIWAGYGLSEWFRAGRLSNG